MGRDLAAQLNIGIRVVGQEKLDLLDKAILRSAGDVRKLAKEYNQLDSASKTMQRVQKDLFPNIFKSAASGVNKLLTIGAKFTAVAYGITHGFRMIKGIAEATMKPVMDFTSAMAQVQIKGGFDAAQTSQLSEAAMRLGRSSIFTPLEGAQAQESLAASGLTPDQIIKNMPTVKKFAIAGGLETTEASDALVNVARQFGLDLNDAHSLERVGSTLVKAANISTISVRDLLQTMKYAGKPGEVSGYQVEDVAGMAAIVGNSGIRGSMGGTGMRNMFSSFAKPKGGKHTDAFLAMLGLSRKDVENGLEHIPEFLEMLEKKMEKKNFSRQKRVGLFASLFGQYGMTAAMVLQKAAGTKVEGLGNAIAATITKIKDSSNELENAFNIRMDTPQAKLDALNARWETLKITIGEMLLPHFEASLGKIIGKLEEFEGRLRNEPEFAQKFESFGAALEHILEMFLKIDGAVTKLVSGSLKTFNDTSESLGQWFAKFGGGDAGGFAVPTTPLDKGTNKSEEKNVSLDMGTKLSSEPGDVATLPGQTSEDPSKMMSPAPDRSYAPSVLDINISVDPGASATIKKLKPSKNQHIRVSRNMATH